MNDTDKKLLHQLAKSLDGITFTFEPPNPVTPKNVTTAFAPGCWRVRMRVQQEQHVLGVTSRLHTALRFADMLQVYLAQQGYRKLNRAQLNFSEAQAVTDFEHKTAGPLLAEIVGLLFPNGVPAKRVVSNRRKTLRDDIVRLEFELDKLKLTVASLQDKVSVL